MAAALFCRSFVRARPSIATRSITPLSGAACRNPVSVPRFAPFVHEPRVFPHLSPIKYFTTAAQMTSIADPNTLSNHHSLVTQFTNLTVALDFKTSTVSGNVYLLMKVLEDSVREVVLDTSFLDIRSAWINHKAAEWNVEDRVEPYGSALRIVLAESPKAGETIDVTVRHNLRSKDGKGCELLMRRNRSSTAPPRSVPRYSG
jgi:hypothetical protein